MNEWSKWMGRIKAAEAHRTEYGNTNGRWDRYIKASAGDFNSEEDIGEEAVDVNMIRATMQTILPPLYTSTPYITVKPTTSEAEIDGRIVDNVMRARFVEAELNHLMTHLRIRERVVRPAVHAAECTNHGYAYIGRTTAKQYGKKGNRIEWDDQVDSGMPFCVYLSPQQVLPCPGFAVLEQAPWVAIEFVKPPAAVRQMFGIGDDEVLETTSTIMGKLHADDDPVLADYLKHEDAGLVHYWQVWDKWTGKVYTLTSGMPDKFLDEGDWPFDVGGFPLVDLTFVDVVDEYWGMPPMEMIWNQQKELNKARTKAAMRNSRTKSTVFVNGEDLSNEIADQLTKSPDGGVIPVRLNDDQDLRRNLLVDAGLPQAVDAYQLGAVMMSDIMFMSGLGAQQRGAGDPNIDTATASANVEKWVTVRASDRGDRTATFYTEIAKKLWRLQRSRKDVKFARRVAGPMAGMFEDLRYSADDLKGLFGFNIDVGTLLPQHPLARRQEAMANYNLFRQDPKVDPDKLILDVIQSQGRPSPERFLIRLRDPEEELQMMVGGDPVEPHEQDDHIRHFQAHQQQLAQLGAAMDQVEQGGPGAQETPDFQRLQVAVILVSAHMNAHGRIVEQITGQPIQSQQAVDPGMLRQQIAASRPESSQETPAELAGQPVAGDGL